MGSRLCSAPLRKCYALRCVRGTLGARLGHNGSPLSWEERSYARLGPAIAVRRRVQTTNALRE
jgi:hypothetical protein